MISIACSCEFRNSLITALEIDLKLQKRAVSVALVLELQMVILAEIANTFRP